MRSILISRRSRLPVDEAWLRLTDWERHGAHVPFTRVVVTTPPPTGVGTRFTARTGVGRAAFEDVMEVVRWHPPAGGRPGHCRLEKRGSLITGWAELEAGPSGSGSWIVWREVLHIAGLPAAFDSVTALCGHWVFGRVVRRLMEE
ncbi:MULTISPECIES: SRPBCC family protein [Streptomyces]|uniref:SRPBCC family protein n=3 Tax=Streptomyces TaxID=1883 RepID=A0A3S9PCS3_STRLT|nr:SRPBCC family protein [Streptomyces luteoverticillatus]AZQ70146.1 SRPBCC family protein [Streptomyces luteoverticillatus]